jgi:hypothetical protein
MNAPDILHYTQTKISASLENTKPNSVPICRHNINFGRGVEKNKLPNWASMIANFATTSKVHVNSGTLIRNGERISKPHEERVKSGRAHALIWHGFRGSALSAIPGGGVASTWYRFRLDFAGTDLVSLGFQGSESTSGFVDISSCPRGWTDVSSSSLQEWREKDQPNVQGREPQCFKL